ncbi:MAG: carbohydrate-binding family V/XII, partial [Candidatus Omnitrophica bacterium]|nr:carbohydrate-binding family V/XII [Candidatus Omnitrophota bacterium]
MKGSVSMRKIVALIVIAAVNLLFIPCSVAVDEMAGSVGQAPSALAWPRVFDEGSTVFSMYQPQVEKWDGVKLEARAAVSAQTKETSKEVFGVIWIDGKADVDKEARIITLRDLKIVKVQFPTVPDREKQYRELLQSELPQRTKEIALDHLEANFAMSQSVEKTYTVNVKNEPPRIIYSELPAILVLIDGEPVLRPVSAAGLERVINTTALIVKTGNKFYLQAMGNWYEAAAVEGPWAVSANPPASLDEVKQAAVAAKQVDLLEPAKDAAPLATPPAIYVSTVPAELIQSDGKAEFLPIEGTNLLQVENSDNAIFMTLEDNYYYVLISGRWFKAKSLSGPWAFVSGKELPADFAKIPADHPKANALVSVPGTPQSKEAVIANSIPQTTAVKRSEAKLNVKYDGAPQFKPIEGTTLQYVANTALPVIKVSESECYAVENGVWFKAPSPAGPWVVADSVPEVIYAIPPTSPLYYVTYVRVYGSTPDEVYVGYTPGYMGTVVTPEYTVVYGTGYYYPPYVGEEWIGYPYTYGFNAGFECGEDEGFAFGFAAGSMFGAWWNPWWGPYGWGWYHGDNNININVNNNNIYNNWKGKVDNWKNNHPNVNPDHRLEPQSSKLQNIKQNFNPYSARDKIKGSDFADKVKDHDFSGERADKLRDSGRAAQSIRGNDVFAGKDGGVYRHNAENGWERNTNDGWRNVEHDRDFASQRANFDRDRMSRD